MCWTWWDGRAWDGTSRLMGPLRGQKQPKELIFERLVLPGQKVHPV